MTTSDTTMTSHERTAPPPEPNRERRPRVTITIAQHVAYEPPPHLVGNEPTRRATTILFETTTARGERRAKAEKRVYAGTETQAALTATADALASLKIPCNVTVRTSNARLVERPASALALNPECWRILARAEARHLVTYELVTAKPTRENGAR